MPATSKAQFRFMKAAEHNPKFAKKVGISPSVAGEYTESNVGKKAYKDLPGHMAKGGLAPTAEAFKQSAKTAKKAEGGDVEDDYYRSNEGAPFSIVNHRTGQVVGKANTIKGARRSRERRDLEYGSYAHSIKDSNGKNRYSNGGVSLAVGRGEKLPTKKGAGLTEKGREKYNRETGSHLKAPQPQGGSRKESFCARMSGVVKHSKGDAERAKASLKRWKCPGW